MQKQRIPYLAGICSLLLALLAACGPQGAGNSGAATKTGDNLYVLDGSTTSAGGSSGQHIVTFHPGSSDATMTLPAGLFSLDHQRIYNATPQNGQTTITITNAQSGATLRTFTIAGTYSTAGTPTYTTAALTLDGKWMALRASDQVGGTIALIDTQAGTLSTKLNLDKNFYLDALSPDGGTVFLLQYLPGQAGRYYVRSYDVGTNHLNEAIIADKAELNDPRMQGSALTRQMSKDGKFAYTLYIDSTHNSAFVHILPLVQGNNLPYPPNIARCLDLPVGKTADLLHYYTLTLSSNGSTLYAVNGALGVINEIDIINTIFDTHIRLSKHFNTGQVHADSNGSALYNGAAISPDNKTLYFVGAQGIWSMSTSDSQIGKNYVSRQAFTGIALSPDGSMLYAVQPQSGITIIDIATGLAKQITQNQVHNPWGIAWITD